LRTFTRSPGTPSRPIHRFQALLDPRTEPEIARDPDARLPVRFRTALKVQLPGIEHQVGMLLAECVAARIDPDSMTAHDDHIDADFVPAGSDLVRVSFMSDREPASDVAPSG
jgi:hypothetical protein